MTNIVHIEPQGRKSQISVEDGKITKRFMKVQFNAQLAAQALLNSDLQSVKDIKRKNNKNFSSPDENIDKDLHNIEEMNESSCIKQHDRNALKERSMIVRLEY